MCGIIGVYSSALYLRETNFFTQGLYMDALRGKDSTGAALINMLTGGNIKPVVDIYKKALPASKYLNSPHYNKFIERSKGSTPRILLGHNRSASKGNIVNSNAHPFREDHIIMVHNGTLWGHKDLPDGSAYDVDSKAICHSIAVQGIEETVKLLDGSFVLVYIDLNEMTLNMTRNSQRPLSIFTCNKSNDVYWSSERLMGESLLTRNNITDYTVWEVTPDTLISFDLTKRKDFRDFKVYDLEPFMPPKRSKWYNGRSIEDEYDSLGNYQTDGYVYKNGIYTRDLTKDTKPKMDNILHLPPPSPECKIDPTNLAKSRLKRLNKQHSALRKIGINPSELLSIITWEYTPYDTGIYGSVKGCTSDEPNINVVVHGVSSDQYSGSNMYTVKPLCTINEGKDTHIVCSNIKLDEENKWDIEEGWEELFEEEEIELESFDPVVMGPNKVYISVKEFEIRTKDGCAMCGDYIESKDSLHISWTSNNEPFCPDCWSEWENALNTTGHEH